MSVALRKSNKSLIEDWRGWPRPTKPEHWKSGRSAIELARQWFVSPVPVCPKEIRALLDSHALTRDVDLCEGWPEHPTSLPMRGFGRHHDMLLRGTNPAGQSVVVSIEAKVDEAFDNEKVGSYWQSKKSSPKYSGVPKRIETLLQIVFGRTAQASAEPWKGLRYQLLTAAGGTARAACKLKTGIAVFVAYELRTDQADEKKLSRNDQDLRQFIDVLFGIDSRKFETGKLYGPTRLTAGKFLCGDVQLLMGKAVFDWKSPSF